MEVTGELGRWIPERYARFDGVETLTCARRRGRALARRDLRRPRRAAVRADRRGAARALDARQDRGAGREREDRHQSAGPRAPAPGPHRSRARDPRPPCCSACSGSRWCSARSAAASRRRPGGAVPTRCRPRSWTCARRWPARWRRRVSTRARPFATSSTGSGATTRTCPWSSTGTRVSRCPHEVEPWPNPCSPRRCAAGQARPAHQRPRARGPQRRDVRARVRNDGIKAQLAGHRHGPAPGRRRSAPARRSGGVRRRAGFGVAGPAGRAAPREEEDE